MPTNLLSAPPVCRLNETKALALSEISNGLQRARDGFTPKFLLVLVAHQYRTTKVNPKDQWASTNIFKIFMALKIIREMCDFPDDI